MIADGLARGGSINSTSPHGGVSRHCLGYAVTGCSVEGEKVAEIRWKNGKSTTPRHSKEMMILPMGSDLVSG